MVEALRIVLVSVVAASLCFIVAYVVGFAAIAAVTVCRRRRHDALSEELDHVLDEILGRQARSSLRRSPGGWRR